jgi:flagellar motility protein MotE (MotC chaperone)
MTLNDALRRALEIDTQKELEEQSRLDDLEETVKKLAEAAIKAKLESNEEPSSSSLDETTQPDVNSV